MLTGCPICEDCLADGSSGTDTSGDGDGDGDGEPAVCGDAIVQPGEECDDGNTNELDTCTTLCVAPIASGVPSLLPTTESYPQTPAMPTMVGLSDRQRDTIVVNRNSANLGYGSRCRLRRRGSHCS
jgi:cysteine-rich repeat protein